MRKLVTLTGSTVLSAVGWWLGNFVGLGTAIVVGAIGAGVGFYIGGRLAGYLGS